MSSLRRLAQKNNAPGEPPASPAPRKTLGTAPHTPSPLSPFNGPRRAPPASPESPLDGRGAPRLLPATPKRPTLVHAASSPLSSPSLSASTPFDWAAARARRPPPYGGTPTAKAKKRQSVGGVGATKRFVRQKSLVQRIQDIPAWIAFEISIFPANVPLPPPKTAAYMIGGTMHVLHLLARISHWQGRRAHTTPGAEHNLIKEWDDEAFVSDAWFTWTTPVIALLFLLSFLNAFYVFTRIKTYHLHQQPDPVASPNASFVPVAFDLAPPPPPALAARVRAGAWTLIVAGWRWLFALAPSRTPSGSGNARRVQQLDVWAPGELELALLAVYSPMHALLWSAATGANWILMGLAMGVAGAQIRALTAAYERLLRDRAIIAAEVMHEYDTKFVYPRVNPIRKDAAVMTHESEMVNLWE